MLGSAFLVGGLWHPTQSFNREGGNNIAPRFWWSYKDSLYVLVFGNVMELGRRWLVTVLFAELIYGMVHYLSMLPLIVDTTLRLDVPCACK